MAQNSCFLIWGVGRIIGGSLLTHVLSQVVEAFLTSLHCLEPKLRDAQSCLLQMGRKWVSYGEETGRMSS